MQGAIKKGKRRHSKLIKVDNQQILEKMTKHKQIILNKSAAKSGLETMSAEHRQERV